MLVLVSFFVFVIININFDYNFPINLLADPFANRVGKWYYILSDLYLFIGAELVKIIFTSYYLIMKTLIIKNNINLDNKEKIKEQIKKYDEANKEKLKEYRKKYYKQYYKANKDRINETNRKWRAKQYFEKLMNKYE